MMSCNLSMGKKSANLQMIFAAWADEAIATGVALASVLQHMSCRLSAVQHLFCHLCDEASNPARSSTQVHTSWGLQSKAPAMPATLLTIKADALKCSVNEMLLLTFSTIFSSQLSSICLDVAR